MRIWHACTNRVYGGTPLALTEEGEFPFAAIEAIGDGFILLTGDSNMAFPAGCSGKGYDNCDLWKNYITLTDDELI